MSSFQQLLVNSTNRLSKHNIIISQPVFPKDQLKNKQFEMIQEKKKPIFSSCSSQLTQQSMQELKLKQMQLQSNIREADLQKNIMMALFQKLMKIQQGQSDKMKKRFRRKKDEIQAKYNCSVHNCKKTYSSSTSMARHMKLKHSSIQFQPPQPYYQVPPSPNLPQQEEDGSQVYKRDETNQNISQFDQNQSSEIIHSLIQNQQLNKNQLKRKATNRIQVNISNKSKNKIHKQHQPQEQQLQIQNLFNRSQKQSTQEYKESYEQSMQSLKQKGEQQKQFKQNQLLLIQNASKQMGKSDSITKNDQQS